ncbi:MAG: hypothetical protein ACD_29C00049G0005 [uncultured bacterium]|nr:MAG: hypothetical protein ACD_29C00049G0005 [uncultured bacterium]
MIENLNQKENERFSFICFDPIASLSIYKDDGQNPLNAIRDFQSTYATSTRKEMAELMTNSVGFFTYDSVRYFEELPDRHAINSAFPAILFQCHQLNVTFDHKKQTILISVLVKTGEKSAVIYQQAQEKIKKIINLLLSGYKVSQPQNRNTDATVEADIADSDFIRMVEKAKNYIACGDAFQIVLSRCFKRHYSVSPLEIYKTLREVSPAPFMFYFPTESSVIIGASPERFMRVHHNEITVNPIAGTRKRTMGKTDSMISDDLLNDKKEIAEHMMLVDLARNDVGVVSDPGSVQVRELLKVKHYSHVSHITSTVTGQLQKKYDALDAFFAAFPAGTLSGAPKIRAMQIIDELETSRRGLYGGAICRFDSVQNFESCIAIRMAILKDGVATIRTGAGIVYDSNPENEAEETYQKARSLLDAIAKAHGE